MTVFACSTLVKTYLKNNHSYLELITHDDRSAKINKARKNDQIIIIVRLPITDSILLARTYIHNIYPLNLKSERFFFIKKVCLFDLHIPLVEVVLLHRIDNSLALYHGYRHVVNISNQIIT